MYTFVVLSFCAVTLCEIESRTLSLLSHTMHFVPYNITSITIDILIVEARITCSMTQPNTHLDHDCDHIDFFNSRHTAVDILAQALVVGSRTQACFFLACGHELKILLVSLYLEFSASRSSSMKVP